MVASDADAIFETIFRVAPIGMILTDRDTVMFKVNRAFASMLGYEPDDLVGRSWRDVTHPEDLDLNLGLFRTQIQGDGSPYELEKRYLRSDGTVVWASVMCHPVFKDGEFAFQITQVVDISERRAHLEALRRMVEEKDRLISSVSHELRTPLTVVYGLAEELRAGLDRFDRDELRELVDLLAGQAREVSHLVEDLLVAARAESGRLTIVAGEVDLREQVDQVIRVLDLDGILIEQTTDRRALADPFRVRQILRNLICNASTHGGGEISVRLSECDTGVEVEVSDRGPGVPPGMEERIFEPYESSGGDPVGSMGLGLTVSRTLAHLMGGDLILRPGGPGSRFVLTLPSYDPAASR